MVNILLAGIFLLPLVYSSQLNLSFELAKSLFSKELIVFATIFFSLYFVKSKTDLKAPQKAILVILALFFISQLIATAFSIVPSESFFGSYNRQQGFLQLIHYILWFFLVINIFRPNDFSKISRVTIIGTALVSLVAILQKFGFDILSFGFGKALEQSYGTLGHPNFLAQYLIFTVPLAAYGLISSHHKWRVISIISVILQLTAFILSGSRAGLLGLVAALTIFIIIQRNSPLLARFKKIIIAGAFLGISCFALINIFPNSPIVTGLPALQRLVFTQSTNTYSTNTQSISIRFQLWSTAVKILQQSPLIGFGLESTPYLLQKHITPEMLEQEDYRSIPDRVHSEPLDMFITSGVFGLTTWYLFLISICFLGLRHILKTPHSESRFRTSLLISAIIGNQIANFFGFSTTIHYLFLYLFLGLIVIEIVNFQQIKPGKFTPKIFFLVSTLFFLFSTYLNSITAYSDHEFKKWQTDETNNSNFIKLSQYTYYHPFIIAELLRTDLVFARDLVNQALQKNSFSSDLYTLNAALLARESQGATPEVEQNFQKAIDLFPLSPLAWQFFGQTSFELGDYAKAIEKYEYLLSFSPKFWQWDEEISTKSDRERLQYQAFFKHNPDFRQIFLYLARAYFLEKNPEKALTYLNHADQNIDTFSTYGVIYGAIGDSEKAREYFEKALKIDPTNETILHNLQKLPN